MPQITDALLKKGYSEKDIQKILGGNLVRVMEEVQRVGQRIRSQEVRKQPGAEAERVMWGESALRDCVVSSIG